jgi:hypothetical protein
LSVVVVVVVPMEAPVVVVVSCDLTRRKQYLQARRRLSLSAQAGRVEAGSEAP